MLVWQRCGERRGEEMIHPGSWRELSMGGFREWPWRGARPRWVQWSIALLSALAASYVILRLGF